MKKVLIISYYWPPAGGSGVQRWLKFSKYLPQNGWKPFIYTPDSPSFEVSDSDIDNNISSDITVWKTKIWEPYSLKDRIFGKNSNDNAGIIQNRDSFKNKVLNWIRGNVFIPDPKIYWVKKSIKFLLSKIHKEKITHIVTTGPPHSMHLIGLGLKKKIESLKWIADFRDPWSELDLLDEFYLSNWARKKHKKLERKVLKNADATLTVSETWVKSFQQLGSNNVQLITNGFDPDDFLNKERKNDQFIIGHYGLLNHLRNPQILWRVLNELCDERSDFAEKLEIHLSGTIDSEVLQNISKYVNLKDKIKFLGYLSHKQVIEEYTQSSVLLLLVFNSSSGSGNYPAKIFEYFAANKPILAFGPETSDVRNLIISTKTGNYYTYEEVRDLKEYLMNIFEKKFDKISVDSLSRFSRKNLTTNLSNLLNSL